MIIKTCKISFLHQATQNMTGKSCRPRLSHTLLQWRPCRLVPGLANIWDRTSPNRNEMKVKSPNCYYLSLFVQPMISSWYLFKTCILGAKRDWDWEINASARQYFKATVFARKQLKVFATPTARKDHEATPKQCLMSEPESKQIHRSRIASFTSKV